MTPYTFAQLKQIALEAAGQSNRSTNDVGDIVNDAIQYLSTMHPWHWRQAALSLNLVADQEYVALPANFGELVTAYYATNSLIALEETSLQRIMQLRSAGDLVDQTSGRLLYAVQYVTQTNQTSLPTYQLALWPTPAANATAAILGVYRRQLPKLTTDGHYPDMPGNFQFLLRQLVRAMAVSGVEQQRGEDWQVFKEALPAYILADGRQQPGLGQMQTIQGTAIHRYRPTISNT